MTIGLTLESILIDLGEIEFAAGLTYVVLSRVKKLIDLVFIVYCNKECFDKVSRSKAAKLKIEFLKHLHTRATGIIYCHTIVWIYKLIM